MFRRNHALRPSRPALKPADFHVLLALAEAPLHGYGLMKEVAAQSEGAVQLEIGSLYRLLDRLLLEGLIAADLSGTAGGDERRRYYQLTPYGRRVLQAEAARLRGLVHRLRKHPLLGNTGATR